MKRVKLINSKLLTYNIKTRPSVSNKTRLMKHKNKKALNCVVSNLMSCVRKGEQLIYLRGKFTHTFNSLTSAQIVSAVDFLVDCGLVHNEIGVGSVHKDFRSHSILTPTELFLETFEPLIVNTTTMPLPREEEAYKPSTLLTELDYLQTVEVVELRDLSKIAIPYKNTKEIKEMREVVRSLNLLNSKHVFLCKNGDEITNVYARIFSREDFNLGGRWYRSGIMSLHNRTTKARLDVTIDGDSVVEVDFSCLHFRIAAALFGIDEDLIPIDLYTEPLKKLLKEGEDWLEYDSVTDRSIIKLAVNILFNSKSLRSASGAIKRVLEELSPSEREKSRLASSQDVVALVFECYPEYIPYFRGEVENLGLILQRRDSNIVDRVVREFISFDKPILPIHDSFLVKEEDLDLLLNSMEKGFKDELGVDFLIPVSVEYKLKGKVVKKQIIL